MIPLSYRFVSFWLGHLIFAGLLLLAFLFAEERILYADCAYHLFRFFYADGGFLIPGNRFATVLTQILPVSFIALKLPLKLIVVAYSLNFVLVQYACFAFIHFYLKKYKYAIALALCYVVAWKTLFFWPQSELQTALAFLFVFISFADRNIRGSKILHYLIASLLLIATVFLHPVIIFPFVGWMPALYFENKNRDLLFFCIGGIIIFILKLIFTSEHSYDAGKYNQFEWINLVYVFSSKSLIQFFEWLWKDAFLLIPFIITFIYYWIKNRSVFFSILLLLSIVYLAINFATFYEGADITYLENLFLPISILIVGGVIFEWTKTIQHINYKMFFLVLVGVIGLIQNGNGRFSSTRHLHAVKAITSNTPHEKALINNTNLCSSSLKETWGVPFESLFISKIHNNKSATVSFAQSEERSERMLSKTGKFDASFFMGKTELLNPHYFSFDSNSLYVIWKDISVSEACD